MHPSLAEHFVRYIALYKDQAEIGRVYLHPVFSAPKVTFTIALDEGGMLRAVAEPTHSAAWEASRRSPSCPERAGYFAGEARWSPGVAASPVTVTSLEARPRRSCQIWSVYCPGGKLSSRKCPCPSVIA